MDHRALTQAIAGLSRAAVWDLSTRSMLRALCDSAALALPADAVAVMSADVEMKRFVHASSPAVAQLERHQESLGTGPAFDAARTGMLVLASQATAEAAWPHFAAAARGADIHAVASLPLMARGRCWGVLDLYRGAGHIFDQEELNAAETLVAIATAYVVMAADREAHRLVAADLAYRDAHDQLTGLANRGSIEQHLDQALQSASGRGRRVGVLAIAIGGLKAVNDTLGYTAGDGVLREVAQRLRDATGVHDTVGRLFGNQFVVITSDLPLEPPPVSRRALHTMADDVSTSLAYVVRVADRTVTVHANIGSALANESSLACDLLREARDAA